MAKKKLGPQVPVGYIWCKDQWIPVGRCAGCWRHKRCVILKAYKEAQTDGQNLEVRGNVKDIPKGKNHKGK